MSLSQEEIEALKKRAERFGIVAPLIPAEEAAKKAKRAERFGAAPSGGKAPAAAAATIALPPMSAEDLAKMEARKKKFGIPA